MHDVPHIISAVSASAFTFSHLQVLLDIVRVLEHLHTRYINSPKPFAAILHCTGAA
jgi:hypothetical protein